MLILGHAGRVQAALLGVLVTDAACHQTALAICAVHGEEDVSEMWSGRGVDVERVVVRVRRVGMYPLHPPASVFIGSGWPSGCIWQSWHLRWRSLRHLPLRSGTWPPYLVVDCWRLGRPRHGRPWRHCPRLLLQHR